MGDPAHKAERKRASGDLLTYQQLYALWERSNWRAHELDFSVDREQWLISPTEGQMHTTSRWRASTSARSASPPTSRRSCSPPERRGGGVPGDPARGRDAPRRVLRPLRRGGDGAVGRRPARAPRGDGGGRCSGPGASSSTTRFATSRTASRPARRPRAVRRGHRDLPHGHRGGPGDDGPANDPPVHVRPRPLSGLPEGVLPGRAGRAPPHRVRRPLPARRLPRAARDGKVVLDTLERLLPRAAEVFVPPEVDEPGRVHLLRRTTRRRSTASPTWRSSGA